MRYTFIRIIKNVITMNDYLIMSRIVEWSIWIIIECCEDFIKCLTFLII